MDDLTLSITDLKAKVEKLVNLHQQLKKDNERLTLDNIKLLNVIDEQKSQIEAVEKRNLELTANTKEEQQQVITETKEKINELVQEIENCIALLK